MYAAHAKRRSTVRYLYHSIVPNFVLYTYISHINGILGRMLIIHKLIVRGFKLQQIYVYVFILCPRK